MGSALRLALLFRQRFWTAVDPRLDRLSFLHTPAGPFNVWWTAFPDRLPLLVGWAGGPRARELAGKAEALLVERALDQLAGALAMPRHTLDRSFETSFTHDWQSDPLASGAYSYAAVGGATAGADLARPIAGTLFLAGEATAPPGENGTVESAIASGRHAARELVAALTRSGC